MRRFLIATHTHFAQGISECIELLSGEHENVEVLCLYVDGNDDAEALLASRVEALPEGDELIICTDILGGSVNNECLRLIQRTCGVFLITNTNLPLLLQLLFMPEGGDTAQLIRGIVTADETRVTFCNDLLSDEDDEEEF